MEKQDDVIILIAEDNDGHAELIRGDLEDLGFYNKIIRFINGEEAWHFLSGTSDAEVHDTAKSYILLLDINMPIMDGIELLKRIRANESLKTLPVIMVSTTDDADEIESCYKIGCNNYVTKPVDPDIFSGALNSVGLC